MTTQAQGPQPGGHIVSIYVVRVEWNESLTVSEMHDVEPAKIRSAKHTRQRIKLGKGEFTSSQQQPSLQPCEYPIDTGSWQI